MKDFALRIVRNNFAEVRTETFLSTVLVWFLLFYFHFQLAKSDGINKLSKELLLDIIADISNLPIKLANNNSSIISGSISSQTGGSLSPAALSTLWQNASSNSSASQASPVGASFLHQQQSQHGEDTLSRFKSRNDADWVLYLLFSQLFYAPNPVIVVEVSKTRESVD